MLSLPNPWSSGRMKRTRLPQLSVVGGRSSGTTRVAGTWHNAEWADTSASAAHPRPTTFAMHSKVGLRSVTL